MVYLNVKKMNLIEKSAKTQLIIGCVLVAFFLFGVVGGILDSSEGLREGLPVYVVCIIPSALPIIFSIKKKTMCSRAVRVNEMFRSDEDGFIRMEQLMGPVGVDNPYKALSIVQDLIGAGLLINCTVEYKDTTLIRLYKTNDSGQVLVATKNCPSCGGVVQVRNGYISACPFCGTQVQ